MHFPTILSIITTA